MFLNDLYERLLECLELEMYFFLGPGTLLLYPKFCEIKISISEPEYWHSPFRPFQQKCIKKDKPLETASTTVSFLSISSGRVYKAR